LQADDVPAAQMAGALQRQECLFNIVENDGIASEPGHVVGQDVGVRSDIMHVVLSGHFADDDTVILDDVEQTLLALQRAGHLSRRDVVRLQASYLREAKL